MLLKLFFVIAGVALIAAGLLTLEQRQLLAAHAMADLHVQMDTDRKATWDAQAQIAEGTHPVALRAAVQRIGLDLEPLPAADASGIEPAVAWPSLNEFQHAPSPSLPRTAPPETNAEVNTTAHTREAAETQP